MKPVRRFFARLGNWASQRRLDERLKEEMEEHLAMQAEDNLYSYRRASMGSILAALFAGKYPAIEATRSNTTTAAARLNGSVPLRP